MRHNSLIQSRRTSTTWSNSWLRRTTERKKTTQLSSRDQQSTIRLFLCRSHKASHTLESPNLGMSLTFMRDERRAVHQQVSLTYQSALQTSLDSGSQTCQYQQSWTLPWVETWPLPSLMARVSHAKTSVSARAALENWLQTTTIGGSVRVTVSIQGLVHWSAVVATMHAQPLRWTATTQ